MGRAQDLKYTILLTQMLDRDHWNCWNYYYDRNCFLSLFCYDYFVLHTYAGWTIKHKLEIPNFICILLAYRGQDIQQKRIIRILKILISYFHKKDEFKPFFPKVLLARHLKHSIRFLYTLNNMHLWIETICNAWLNSTGICFLKEANTLKIKSRSFNSNQSNHYCVLQACEVF